MTNHAGDRAARRGATAAAVVAVVLASVGLLAACGSDDGTSEPPRTTNDAEPSTTSAPDSSETPMRETAIRIVIGEQVLDATLWDNAAARSLVDQLPLTLDFRDYGGQEVLAEPPEPLTMDGMPEGESAPEGTIGYYEPNGVVVLYYTDVPRFSGIVRLGTIDGDVSILRGWSDSRPVTIERAD